MKKIIITTLLSSMTIWAHAQWQQMTSVTAAPTIPVAIDSNTLLIFPGQTYQSREVYKSYDNGASWVNYPLDTTIDYTIINEVQFANDRVGYACGGTPYGGWKVLLKTTNAGERWEKLQVNAMPINTYSIDHISVVNDQIFYLSGNGGNIYKSVDGGQNFQHITLPLTINSSSFITITEINFQSEQEGFVAVLIYDRDSKLYQSSIINTSNGGQTWKPSYYKVWENNPTEWYKINKIQFVDPMHGFAIGSMGHLLTTSDGGKNWFPKSLINNTVVADDVFFVTTQTGYAIMNKEIYKTNDGAETWQQQTNKDSIGLLDRLIFSNKTKGFAFGNYELFGSSETKIYRTYQDFSVLKIDTDNSGNDVNIYPNPVNDFFKLDVANAQKINSVKVFDVKGAYVTTLKNNQNTFSVQGLPMGVYIIKFQIGSTEKSVKIIKN